MKRRPLSIKIADSLTSSFGTLIFLLGNIIFFVTWILINNGKIPRVPAFDPFPYPLLTTSVSLEAIFLAIVVLISQNRDSQINTLRDELQLQVDLIAEKEITKTLKLLTELLKERNIKLDDQELAEMLKQVDTSYIERRLEEELGAESTSISQKAVQTIGQVGEKIEQKIQDSFPSKKQ